MLDVKLAKGHGDEILEIGTGLFEAERRAGAHVDEDPSLPIDPDQIARARLGVFEVVCAGPEDLNVDPPGTAGPTIDHHLEGAFRDRPSQPRIVNVHAPALGVGQGATHQQQRCPEPLGPAKNARHLTHSLCVVKRRGAYHLGVKERVI